MTPEGLLLVDKPSGITSFGVIKVIRKIAGVKKVGHCGTLDPLASGLLLVLIGRKFTKLSGELTQKEKSYWAKMKFFEKTDTGDREGKMIEIQERRTIEKSEIEAVFASFKQAFYQQVPPAYSAIKVRGKKLYQYARKGEPVNIPSREVFISEIKMDTYEEAENTLSFWVTCGKGTYIRSLVEDIARKLKTIAKLEELRRISSGGFKVEQALVLRELTLEKIVSSLIKSNSYL